MTVSVARAGRRGARWLTLAALLLLFGCAAVGPRAPLPPFRLQDAAEAGDPARRASTQLLLEGLAYDTRLQPDLAMGQYERALQVDPTNPYAFLVIARHQAEGVEPERAFSFLDKAEALFSLEPDAPPGVEAHLVGLRGVAFESLGRPESAAPLLERARELAPGAWGDARLDARELR